MVTISYQFSDGHFEDVECTEEFKREYEFMLMHEKAVYWKEMKQKERAGLRCIKDYSLDKYSDDGYDVPASMPDPLETIILNEERQCYYKRLLAPLTDKQREAYIMHHIKGYKKVKIAEKLHISEKAVRKRLLAAQKKIKNFEIGSDLTRFLSMDN